MFEEKKSGKAGTRPAGSRPPSRSSGRGVLVVWKLDRLGYSLVEMMRTIDALAPGRCPLEEPHGAFRQRDGPWSLSTAIGQNG